MKIAQIDRAFFELIRVQLVEEQYTPDRTLYSDAESYLVAKNDLVANGPHGFVVEVFGVGSSYTRGKKTDNIITIDRGSITKGSIGSFGAVYFDKYFDNANEVRFTKLRYPDVGTKNVMYNIRLSTKDLKVERALHELIDQVISNKTCIPVVDEVNGNILTETVDFRTIGYVDVSSTSDLVEYIYTYEVLDVWLAPVSQVKTNIPAIKQILFDVNVKKHNEPLVNDTVPVLVIRRGVVASITVNDTFAGSVAKADMIFTNELGEANQATVILNWNNGGLVETFDLLFLPNETKTLSSIVAVTPDLWLGNVDVMLGGDVEASYTFKVRGLATFIQSNCLQCTANDTFIRLHAAVNINESTILNLGTAVFVRDSIYLTQLNCIASGTLYDLRFSDTIGTPYRFPLSEGGNSRFAQCVLTGLVADVSPVWGKQDFVHWNLKYGATKLVDTVIGNIAFIPYSTSKIRMFNDIPVDGTDYAALIWTFVP